MATVVVDGSDLVVSMKGLDRVAALKSRLAIPLAHVRGVTADPGIVQEPKGWRGPGTHIPGVIVAGTFTQDGDRIFWDVRDMSKTLVIELRDEEYRRVVVDVDDPRSTVDELERALHDLPPQAP